MDNNSEIYFIGVDVGTGSVRAALVNNNGKIIKTSTCPIQTWSPKPDFYEQSSNDIWASCCKVIKDVVNGIKSQDVRGIGFDATCSLVAVDKDGQPVSVSPTGNDEQNIILWMDHRAEYEAKQINETKASVLQYIGGKISLEMEIPKLVWLKKYLKLQCWDRAALFFDLPDFLTWKATGSETRSLCSLVCKWTYEVTESNELGKWNDDFLTQIGLEDLKYNNYSKIGNTVLPPGTPCGSGLKVDIAQELGLLPGTPVGTSIIDAHAGGLGMIACTANNIPIDFDSRIGLICGTSTCHMAVSKDPIFVPGVWGPYFSAMVPNMWLNEGGQSATGKLIDHIIETHLAYSDIKKELGQKHIQEYLSELLIEMGKEEKLPFVDMLTKDFHVWPDFHGNRSPLADPNLKGMKVRYRHKMLGQNLSGLTLSTDYKNLAILYLATIQALAYGTRHIIETLKSSGYKNISQILICGGLSKNPLFVQTQANVTNIPVLCPEEPESVLLGSAILGACAAKTFLNVETACKNMAGKAQVIFPDEEVNMYHNKKYKVFLKMIQDQKEYDNIMNL